MRTLIAAIAIATAVPADAEYIYPTDINYNTRFGFLHDVYYNDDYVRVTAGGSVNEGWPSFDLVWQFTTVEPKLLVQDWYAFGQQTSDPFASPVPRMASWTWGVDDTYYGGVVGTTLFTDRPDNSFYLPAGDHYVFAGINGGDSITGTFTTQLINVPEPGSIQQMLLGLGIGILAYLGIRFAFPPEGGYIGWREWLQKKSVDSQAHSPYPSTMRGRPTRVRAEVQGDELFSIKDDDPRWYVDLEHFVAGKCPGCKDEQLICTATLPTGSDREMQKRYVCNNCGESLAARYVLTNVARVAKPEVEV